MSGWTVPGSGFSSRDGEALGLWGGPLASPLRRPLGVTPLLPRDAAAAFIPSGFAEALYSGFPLRLWMTRAVAGFPFIC